MKRYGASILIMIIISAGLNGKLYAMSGLNPGLLASASTMKEGGQPGDIPDVLVAFASGDGVAYFVVVEKETQQLFLYAYDGIFKRIFQMPCSTGEVLGPKIRSGDKKTPEGVYFFTREYQRRDLAPLYGSRAFPTDYPNLLDRIRKRSGYAIWLHGTNKDLKVRDTNGCVALVNRDIDELGKFIRLNRTPIVITHKLKYKSLHDRQQRQQKMLSFLQRWKNTCRYGTYEDYLQLYDQGQFPAITWWTWYKRKKRVFVLNSSLSIDLRRIAVLKHGQVFVVIFDKYIKYLEEDILVGTQKLFIAVKSDRMQIIGEEFQILPPEFKGDPTKDPLIVAFETLKERLRTEQKIAYVPKGR